jgi:hypothetical protein
MHALVLLLHAAVLLIFMGLLSAVLLENLLLKDIMIVLLVDSLEFIFQF